MADIEVNQKAQSILNPGTQTEPRCPKCRGVLKCSDFPDLYYSCTKCGHTLWIIPPKDKEG